MSPTIDDENISDCVFDLVEKLLDVGELDLW